MEYLDLLLKTLGLGLLTGFVFGYLFKKISKILVFLMAVVVVLVIVFGHNEILDIDWLSVKDKFDDLINPHLAQYHDRLMLFMRNTPFVIGFILGGLLGLKWG